MEECNHWLGFYVYEDQKVVHVTRELAGTVWRSMPLDVGVGRKVFRYCPQCGASMGKGFDQMIVGEK